MLRFCFAAAAAAAPVAAAAAADTWYLRYLEKQSGGLWSATTTDCYETGGKGLKCPNGEAVKEVVTPVLQSPVYWRRGYGFSVDRTLIRIESFDDLLPISAAHVDIAERCKVTKEEVSKAEFHQAIPGPHPQTCANPKYRFGAGFLPPWKLPATLRFERRFYGDGDILHVKCPDRTEDVEGPKGGKAREYAVATKGAVASKWEHDGCPFKATAKLFPSLLAKYFYVPVSFVFDVTKEMQMQRMSLPVTDRKNPTQCNLIFGAAAPKVNNCRALAGREEYQEGDMVFMSGPKSSGRDAEVRLVEKGGEKPKGRVYLVLHPPKDSKVDVHDSTILVQQGEKKVLFVKKRGGQPQPKSKEPPGVSHDAA